MVNNPLKEYFLNIMKLNNLKNYRELSRFLNVTYGIIGNTMQNNTIFASRKLTEQLSKTLQRKPEDVLCDIYSPYFFQHCPDYLKIITLSLHYHFKYKLYWENNIIIESHLVLLPYIEKQISIHAIMRREGLEAKYTLVLDWCNISKAFSKAFIDSSDCVSNTMDLMNPSYNSLYFFITSGLFALLKLKSMTDIKRVFIVFPTDEAVHYKCIRELLYDYQGGITPLLYDENAEYSIRDVDMLNGIG